jgi:hypothetical protein
VQGAFKVALVFAAIGFVLTLFIKKTEAPAEV